VTVAPEVSRMSVLRKGSSQVSRGTTPSGGQVGEATKLKAGMLALK
jgi:hypothetical protein